MADEDSGPSKKTSLPIFEELERPADSATFGETAAPNPWRQLRDAESAPEFAEIWLTLAAQWIEGLTQAVVVLGPKEHGPFAPVASWPQGITGNRALAQTIEETIGKRVSVRRPRGTQGGASSRRTAIIGVPVAVNGKVYGAVAASVDCDADVLDRAHSKLELGVEWVEAFVRRRWAPPGERLAAVLETVATGVHYPGFQDAATAVVTELAARLGCERACIGFLDGRHVRLRAVSHSAVFGRKANLVRAVEAAMEEAIDQQVTVSFPAPDGESFLVTREHAALHDVNGALAICTIPFADAQQVLGAITLEMPPGKVLNEASVRLCEHAASLLGPIFESKRRDERWIGRRIRDGAKAYANAVLGPRDAGLKIVSLAVVTACLFFVFADGNYRVTADARLEGSVQRVIAAPMDGYIEASGVRAGDTVEAGAVLARLDGRDLRLERLKWSSQRSQRRREQSEARAQGDRAQAGILDAQIRQADAQLALLDAQLDRIAVTSPFDGIVVSGDLSQSLGAPIERGEVLFEVAPLDSYRVILQVDERDIGNVSEGLTGSLALTGSPQDRLDIRIDKLTPVSTAEEGRNYFRVEASLVDPPAGILRPGMEGVGKIDAGERRLIWIWTHKVVYWMRMFFWSWWP